MAQLVLVPAASAFATAASLSAFQATTLITAASLTGFFIDQELFQTHTLEESERDQQLSDVTLTGSSESATIPKIVGRWKTGGNIFWATQYRVEVIRNTEEQVTRVKKSSQTQRTTTIEYLFYMSFAIGICEGPIIGVRKIWADGDLWVPKTTYELYKGTETQPPSPIIQRIQGSGNVPAYRGLAYMVFENLPLKDFGNRIPQLQFEVLTVPVDQLDNQGTLVTSQYPDVDSLMVNTNGGNFSLARERLYHIDLLEANRMGLDEEEFDDLQQRHAIYG